MVAPRPLGQRVGARLACLGMVCPKCQGPMHTLDRQGIHIEQCERCRGVFLDFGELEQISGAEQRYYQGNQAPPPYQGPATAPSPGYAAPGRYPDSPPAHRGGHYPDSPPPYGKKRKRSFLEGLFD